jgi:hypothetical protein
VQCGSDVALTNIYFLRLLSNPPRLSLYKYSDIKIKTDDVGASWCLCTYAPCLEISEGIEIQLHVFTHIAESRDKIFLLKHLIF